MKKNKIYQKLLTFIIATIMMNGYIHNSIPVFAENILQMTEPIITEIQEENYTEISESVFVEAEVYKDFSYSERLYDVSINVKGNFPENAIVRAYPVEWNAVDEDTDVIVAFDITVFEQDGITVFESQDDTFEVSINIGEINNPFGREISVYHIHDDGNVEIIEVSEILEEETVVFETDSFSVFSVTFTGLPSGYTVTDKIHFIDQFENEISPVRDATLSVPYREQFDLQSYAESFDIDAALDNSINEHYEFSHVEIWLTNNTKHDVRYMYAGTISDLSGSTSTSGYRLYFYLDSISDCLTGGNSQGLYYTGSQNIDNIYFVFNHVRNVTLTKKDEYGGTVSGAEYGLYLDSSCSTPYHKNDIQVTAVSHSNGVLDFGDIPYGTYYMKELNAPFGYKLDSKIYTLNVNKNIRDKDMNIFTEIKDEDDDGSLQVSGVKDLTLNHVWEDGNENHQNDSVTLGLYTNGVFIDSMTLTSADNWSGTFNNLNPDYTYVVQMNSIVVNGEECVNQWKTSHQEEIDKQTKSTIWNQVSTILSGETYLFISSGYALGYNRALRQVQYTITENTIVDDKNENIMWTVNANANTYTLYNQSSKSYLRYNSGWSLNSSPQNLRILFSDTGTTARIAYLPSTNDGVYSYLLANGTTNYTYSTSSGTNFTVYKKTTVQNQTYTITSSPNTVNVSFQKQDLYSTSPIQSVEMTLYDENGNVITMLTSDINGWLTDETYSEFSLYPGYYTIIENTTPEGYFQPEQDFTFRVRPNGKISILYNEFNNEKPDFEYLFENNSGYQINIPNEPQSILYLDKISAFTGEKMSDVKLILYEEDEDGNTVTFNENRISAEVYQNIQTSNISQKLTLHRNHTYILEETETIEPYQLLKGKIMLNISSDGIITVVSEEKVNSKLVNYENGILTVKNELLPTSPETGIENNLPKGRAYSLYLMMLFSVCCIIIKIHHCENEEVQKLGKKPFSSSGSSGNGNQQKKKYP